MRLLALLSVPLLLSISLAGCGRAGRTAGPVVRDSAGVTIVENSSPRWADGAGWRLSAEPLLDIGVVEGDPMYQLDRVSGAFRLDDGRFVVANGGTRELRYYDAEGQFLLATGRKGGGPGEFEELYWIRQAIGDSLLAYDWRNRRISVFDDQGNFVRAYGLRVMEQRGSFPVYAGVFPDGTMLLATEMAYTGQEPTEGAKRDSAVYYRCDAGGAVIDTIATLAGEESFIKLEGEAAIAGGLLFGRSGQAAVLDNGFYYGSADSYEIGYHDMQGRQLRSIRLDERRKAVTQEEIDTYIQRRFEDAGDDSRRQLLRKFFEDMPIPDEMPSYDQFITDEEGNLWVADYPLPTDDQPRWNVFDRDGQLLGKVEAPRQFLIYQIGPDFVLGRWHDELGVQHIRMYELLKD
jgi:hypothetical protein